MQEKLEITKANENMANQRAEGKKDGKVGSKKPNSSNSRNFNSPLPANKRKRNNHSSTKTGVADDSPCPVHPGAFTPGVNAS